MASKRQQIACLFLLELLHWCLSKYVEPPKHTDAKFIKHLVDEHNKYRSSVKPSATNMYYMSWDKKLAETALAWVKLCKFSHNPQLHTGGLHPSFGTLGQNLWAGSAQIPLEPTKQWVETEVGNYNFEKRKCSGGMCGHYTQVVWGDSYRVGCAAVFCAQVEGLSFPDAMLIACDYGPAGNYRGKAPYTAGKWCSGCPKGDKCVNNLCTNEKRDQGQGPTSGGPGSGGATKKKRSSGKRTLLPFYSGTQFFHLHFALAAFTLTRFAV